MPSPCPTVARSRHGAPRPVWRFRTAFRRIRSIGPVIRGLFAAGALPPDAGPHQVLVPPAFVKLAGSVIWHSAAERFALLYQALWRIDRHDGTPLSQADPLGRRLALLAKGVGRDIHKMHAFRPVSRMPERWAAPPLCGLV